MFGINDPGIWLAYLLAFGCVAYAIVFGIVMWNRDDPDSAHPKTPER